MRICLLILILLAGCGDVGQKFYHAKDPTEVFYVVENAENFSVAENILGRFSVVVEDNSQVFNVAKSADRDLGHYTQNEEVVTVETVNKADIVWSIDNSGSMAAYQTKMAESFSLFIKDFIQKNIDFKMAIVTTDSAVNRDSNGKLTSSELKKNKQSFIDDFKNKVKVGTSGKNHEYSFHYVRQFLRLNPSWIRNDALLAVIYLSDEKEQSSKTVQQRADYMFSLKGNNKDRVRVFSICNKAKNQCDRFENLSHLTNGFSRSISDSFNEVSKQFGESIVRTITSLETSISLSHTPVNLSNLMVEVNGKKVPQDTLEKDGWNYNAVANVIEFFGNHIPPSKARIRVWEEGTVASSFRLKEPLASDDLASLLVYIDGVTIPRDTLEKDGWNHDDTANTIEFFGSYLPSKGEKVSLVVPGEVPDHICLGRAVNVDKLEVVVDGNLIPKDATKTNGWAYDGENHCVGFFGSHTLSRNVAVKMSLGVNSRFCLKKGFDLSALDDVEVVVGDIKIVRDETESMGWNYNPINHCVELFGIHGLKPDTPVKISLGLTSKFCLDKPLDESKLETIEMKVDGKLIERGGEGKGWDYDGKSNCIEFFDSDSIGENSKVEITYRANYR